MLVVGPDGELVAGPRGHRAPAPPRVALAPAGQRLLRRRRPLHHRRGGREGLGDARSRAGREPLRLKLPDRRGRRLRGRARGARPAGPRAGGERRPLRRRRPARGLAEAGRRRSSRVAPDQPRYEPGRHRGLVLEEPVPDGARALHRRGAGGQPLLVARGRDGAATFRLPIEGHFTPAPAGALPPDARPPARHRTPCPATPPTSASPRRSRATAWLDVNPVANQLTASSSTRRGRGPGRRST